MPGKTEKLYYRSGALRDEWVEVDGKRNGAYKRYYESGALRFIFNFCEDLMEGPQEEYFENGQLQVRRVYSGGSVVNSVVAAMNSDGSLAEKEFWTAGRCRCFNVSGCLTREFELFNGLREGLYQSYYPNGKRYEELNFVNGLRHGECKTYYDNGSLESVFSYRYDEIEGVGRQYFPTGKIKLETCSRDGKPHGVVKFYYPNGELCEEDMYEDGVRNGYARKYHENGTLELECFYDYGLEEGAYNTYYEDGNPKIRCFYHKGLLTGEFIWFHNNGRVFFSLDYANGVVKNGMITLFDEDGSVKAVDRWENGICSRYDSSENLILEFCGFNGKKNGVEKSYYEKGRIERECEYQDGDLEGVYKYYDKEGNLLQQWYYHKGYPDGSCLDFYPSGEVKTKQVFASGMLTEPVLDFYKSGAVERNFPVADGKYNGLGHIYYENGAVQWEIPLSNGVFEGVAVGYDESGEMIEELSYHNNKADGVRKCYRNGRVVAESNYEQGLLQGFCKIFNEDGQVFRSSMYVDDECLGCKEMKYYPSGNLMSETDVEGNYPVGQEVTYHENGVVAERISYENGMVKDGKSEVFDENGERDGCCIYKNNVGRQYDGEGKLIAEWQNYRFMWNGLMRRYDFEELVYMFDGRPCESKEEFLDETFEVLAEKCVTRFAETSPEYDEESYWSFFADEYKRAMGSAAAAIEYDDYAELERCNEDEIPDEHFVDYVVREFMLRLRLPNDGETERRILGDLKSMLGFV